MNPDQSEEFIPRPIGPNEAKRLENAQEYIDYAYLAKDEYGDTLWELFSPEGEKLLAAASTYETDGNTFIRYIGRLEKGAGMDLLERIANWSKAHHENVLVGATLATQPYYEWLGFNHAEDDVMEVEPDVLLQRIKQIRIEEAEEKEK